MQVLAILAVLAILVNVASEKLATFEKTLDTHR